MRSQPVFLFASRGRRFSPHFSLSHSLRPSQTKIRINSVFECQAGVLHAALTLYRIAASPNLAVLADFIPTGALASIVGLLASGPTAPAGASTSSLSGSDPPSDIRPCYKVVRSA